MNEAVTTIVYDGALLKQGKMDVRTLAPALLAIGKVCEVAHEIVNHNDKGISVRVKTDKFKTGSFEIDLSIFIPLLEQAKSLFATDGYKTSKEVLGILGFVGSTGIGLIALIKRLKGKKKKEVIIDSNGVTIETNSEKITVKKEVWDLYNNPIVRRELANAISPLEQDGIDTFKIKENNKEIERITEDQLDYFTSNFFEEKKYEETTQVLLQVDTAHITNANKKWRFSTVGESPINISAYIKDKDYLNKAENGEILFRHGICIRATLITRTIVSDGKETVEYEIDNVKHDPDDQLKFQLK